MTETPSLPLLREAVARDGYRCVVCGRPCQDHDARRRIDAGALGDTPDNWSAMCAPCRVWLDGKAPPPARYIAHIHDARRLRRIARKVVGYGAILLAVAVLMALGAMAGWLIYTSRHGIWELLGAALLIVLLLVLGGGLLKGLFGSADEAPVQRVHHSFDEQHVHLREGR